MTTLEKKNINPTLQQFLHNPQITIINNKMKKEIQNSSHHIPQYHLPKTQKVHFMKRKKSHTIPTKTTTIINYINHKTSQIFCRTRKNTSPKHLSLQIIMIINLKNHMKKNMCHIIINRIYMTKYHPKKLKIKLQLLKTVD